jgi:hypothetical protein
MVKNYHKNSKFGGYLTNLEKVCTKIQIRYLPPITQGDYNEAGVYFDRFGDMTKWQDTPMSPNYMFCFCLRMLSEGKYLRSDKLLKIMTDLVAYQEENGKIDDSHYEDGDKAYTWWLNCWGEKDEDEHDAEISENILQKTTADAIRKINFEHYKDTVYGSNNAK